MFAIILFLGLQISLANCATSKTIVEYLQENGFNTLVDLVNHAGVLNTLNDTAGPYTVFAPTDAAFAKLPPALLASLKAVDTTALTNLVLFHVSRGVYIGPLFRDGLTLPSLDQEKNPTLIHINKYANGAVTAEGALISSADVVVSNGVIHVVDSVMFPAQISISEYLSMDENEFQDLFASIVLANLESTLAGSGNFTIFAPNNEAFNKVQDGLLTLTSDIIRLTETLKYHVVPRVMYSPGLTDGQKLTTLQGNQLTVHIDGNGVRVDNGRVLRTDQVLTNGVLHVIDTLLLP